MRLNAKTGTRTEVFWESSTGPRASGSDWHNKLQQETTNRPTNQSTNQTNQTKPNQTKLTNKQKETYEKVPPIPSSKIQ